MTYLFLDCETTSLSPERGHVWEIGIAFDDEPAESFVVNHSLVNANMQSLEIGDYWRRVGGFSAKDGIEREAALVERIKDQSELYIVGANPRFDVNFLNKRWGGESWSHRLIDVQVYAMGAFRTQFPLSLTSVADLVRGLGFEIPENKHTAASDVECTRAVFLALQKVYEERR